MKIRTVAILALLALAAACTTAGPTAVDSPPDQPVLDSSGGMGSGH